MKKGIVISIILIISLALGILIYKSPHKAYWLQVNPQDAIKIGRLYAFYLLNGNKQELLKMSFNQAKEKIEKSNIKEFFCDATTFSRLEEEKKIPSYILYPLYPEQKDMELVALESLESFIVMTFAYKSLDEIVKIPEKGRMLFSVGVRYYEPTDNRLVPKLIRKIANLPLLRNFTGNIGTTGRWVVFDFNYKYNLNNYFDWTLKEKENISQENKKKAEEFARQLKNKETSKKFMEKISESSNMGLAFLYEWGGMTVESQIEHLEKLYMELYKAQEEVKEENNR